MITLADALTVEKIKIKLRFSIYYLFFIEEIVSGII
jgi:hypothetical protein